MSVLWFIILVVFLFLLCMCCCSGKSGENATFSAPIQVTSTHYVQSTETGPDGITRTAESTSVTSPPVGWTVAMPPTASGTNSPAGITPYPPQPTGGPITQMPMPMPMPPSGSPYGGPTMVPSAGPDVATMDLPSYEQAVSDSYKKQSPYNPSFHG